jgi:hypothetical protein
MRSDGLWRDSDAASAAFAATVSLTALRPKHRLSRYLPRASRASPDHPAYVACRPRRGSVSAVQKAEPTACAGSSRISDLRGGSLHIPHQRAPHSTRHRHYRSRRVTRRATTGRHQSTLVPSYSQSQASQLQPSSKSHPQTTSYPSATRPGLTVCCSMDPCTEAHGPASAWLALAGLMSCPLPLLASGCSRPCQEYARSTARDPRSAGRALQV